MSSAHIVNFYCFRYINNTVHILSHCGLVTVEDLVMNCYNSAMARPPPSTITASIVAVARCAGGNDAVIMVLPRTGVTLFDENARGACY